MKYRIFNCRMKTREQMEKEIPANQLSWWHDCLAGSIVTLREATEADVKDRWMRKGQSRNPKDYLVELHQNGGLVLKKAILHIDEAKESA